jgi:hypothetical protein
VSRGVPSDWIATCASCRQPAWGVEKVILGLQAFMSTDLPTLGSMEAPEHERRRYASKSLAWNCSKESFRAMFPELEKQLRDSTVVALAPVVAAASSAEEREPLVAQRSTTPRETAPPAAATPAVVPPPSQLRQYGFVIALALIVVLLVLWGRGEDSSYWQ